MSTCNMSGGSCAATRSISPLASPGARATTRNLRPKPPTWLASMSPRQGRPSCYAWTKSPRSRPWKEPNDVLMNKPKTADSNTAEPSPTLAVVVYFDVDDYDHMATGGHVVGCDAGGLQGGVGRPLVPPDGQRPVGAEGEPHESEPQRPVRPKWKPAENPNQAGGGASEPPAHHLGGAPTIRANPPRRTRQIKATRPHPPTRQAPPRPTRRAPPRPTGEQRSAERPDREHPRGRPERLMPLRISFPSIPACKSLIANIQFPFQINQHCLLISFPITSPPRRKIPKAAP